jgi:mRNA interferase MazF
MNDTPANEPFRRGDVVLVLFPNSNLRTAKLRPALVVQADNLGTELDQVIVAMMTSRMFRANHPSRVTVLRDSPEGRGAGILTDSVVMTDNLATVTGRELDQRIGTLPMADVDAALKHTLNLR